MDGQGPRSAPVGLGLLGILGGSILLAAYVVDIPAGWNPLRIVLYNIGAIAVVIGVHRRQAHVAPRRALLVATLAVVANAWYAVMVVLAVDRSSPFAGGDGFIWFIAGLSMWLTDGLFGVVTLRLGATWRVGAIALAVGSPLAILGIDRLGLTSPDDPAIFGALAMTGAVLNGLGWILLGLELVVRRTDPAAEGMIVAAT